jgi:hypothetical protein
VSTYSFSTTVADAALGIFNGTAPTTYSSVYVQLHTGATGSAGITSVSVGSTTRVGNVRDRRHLSVRNLYNPCLRIR